MGVARGQGIRTNLYFLIFYPSVSCDSKTATSAKQIDRLSLLHVVCVCNGDVHVMTHNKAGTITYLFQKAETHDSCLSLLDTAWW